MWEIQYSDELGGQVTRRFDTAESVWVALGDYGQTYPAVKDAVDAAIANGYSLQTTDIGFGGWQESHGFNITLAVIDLDTHTSAGYTLEEWAEIVADSEELRASEDDMPYDASDSENKYPQFEDDDDPLECKTESFTLPTAHTMITGKTNYSVVVTLEADMPTAPMMFEQCAHGAPCTCASVSAENAARMATAILAGTGEPQPLRPTHEDYHTVYRASGFHDVFGEWSVDLIAYDRGEICGTCGEWFVNSDAWGEHNDMAHY